MGSNPITITVPTGCVGQIIAMSNSSSTQRVTISIDTAQAGIFEGSGTATAIALTTGGPSVPISPSPNSQNCSILFEYSQSQSNWTPAAVVTPTTMSADDLTTIQIAANNSSGTENDAVLMISLFSPKASGERAKLVTQDSDPKDNNLSATTRSSDVPNSSMTLHAKTYYDPQVIHGGDEWNIILDFDNPLPISPDLRIIPGEVRTLGWMQTKVHCDWISGNVWNTVSVSVEAWDGVHAGMQDGRLVIVASTWCLGYRPQSWNSPDWNGNLSGCAFTLAKVTP